MPLEHAVQYKNTVVSGQTVVMATHLQDGLHSRCGQYCPEQISSLSTRMEIAIKHLISDVVMLVKIIIIRFILYNARSETVHGATQHIKKLIRRLQLLNKYIKILLLIRIILK